MHIVKDSLLCKNDDFFIYLFIFSFCLNLIQENPFLPILNIQPALFSSKLPNRVNILFTNSIKIYGSSCQSPETYNYENRKVAWQSFLNKQFLTLASHSKNLNIMKIHSKLNIEYIFKNYQMLRVRFHKLMAERHIASHTNTHTHTQMRIHTYTLTNRQTHGNSYSQKHFS